MKKISRSTFLPCWLAVAWLSFSQSSADELLAAWEFNAEDASGEQVAASAGSASNTTGTLQGDAEIKDGALSLDGAGDFLEFGNDLEALRDQDSMTIAAWVQTKSSVSGLRRIVEHEDNTYFWAEGNIFQYTTHGTPGGASGRAQSSTSPEPDVWQHVLVTFTADGPAKMYIDGELEGESSIGQNRIPGNTHTFQIGARRSSSGNPSNFWDGLIDDVGIWNCELAESDIALLSGKGNGGYAGRRSPTNLGAPGFALREGLFMYFSLDNASVDGDLIQDGANHAGAPLNGNKTNGGPTTGAEGQIGQTAEFAGGQNNSGNHFVDLAEHAETARELTQGTIAAWVKPATTDLDTDVLTIMAISNADIGTGEMRFWISNGGQFGTGTLAYQNRGGALDDFVISEGVDLFDEKWHHVAVTVDENQDVILYVDGEENVTGAVGFLDIPDANSMSIGRNKDATPGGGQWFFEGLIDDLGVWERPLSSAEIAFIHTEGLAGRPCCPTDDTNGDGVPDAWYTRFGLDPTSATVGEEDPDGDTLITKSEFEAGTDPTKADTDGDTLRDDAELATHNTNPNKADSDDDGLADGTEINTHQTDPNDNDSDDDGIDDATEISNGTNPNDANDPPPPPCELLAAWEFEPGDISGTDVSATDGTVENTAGALIEDASIVNGALMLDGDGDYLEFGDDLEDLRNQESMTIAAWVQTDSDVSSLRRIVEHEDNIYFWAESNIFQYTTHGTPGGNNGRARSTTSPEPGTWQHMLVSFSANAPAKIYIDGVLEGTSSLGQNPIPGNVHTFQIGARRSSSGNASNFWDGMIDDVAIWNCELQEKDVTLLAGVGAGGYEGRRTPTTLSGGGAPFEITEATRSADGKMFTLTWNSRPGRTYAVQFSENLGKWEELDDSIDSGGETTSFIDDFALLDKAEGYFRVVEGP